MSTNTVPVRGTFWERNMRESPNELAKWTEIDGKPALVFVSHDGTGTWDQAFEDGEELHNARKVTIVSKAGELTEYTTEKYLVVAASELPCKLAKSSAKIAYIIGSENFKGNYED